MADPMSSKTLAFLITTIAMVVQMHFPSSSPADQHPANLWIFMACLFLYAFSSAYYKSHASSISDNETPCSKLSSHLAAISGSMACVALVSVLVSKTGLAVIIIIYFICLFMYFSPNPVTETYKKIASHAYDMWKGIQHHHHPRENLPV